VEKNERVVDKGSGEKTDDDEVTRVGRAQSKDTDWHEAVGETRELIPESEVGPWPHIHHRDHIHVTVNLQLANSVCFTPCFRLTRRYVECRRLETRLVTY